MIFENLKKYCSFHCKKKLEKKQGRGEGGERMPHKMEDGMSAIINGWRRSIRYEDEKNRPGLKCLFPEIVNDHILKLGFVIQILKIFVGMYDKNIEFDGEALSDLVFDHDIGEAHPDDHDKIAPIKTAEDEDKEREHFIEMISFLPKIAQDHFIRIYDLQREDTVTNRLFHAGELAQRLFYVVHEIENGNSHKYLWTAFWQIWNEILPYLNEFNGLRVMMAPIQELALYLD